MAIKARRDELTASDAALALGVSYHAVLRLVQTGKLKGTRRGGHWYVRAREPCMIGEYVFPLTRRPSCVFLAPGSRFKYLRDGWPRRPLCRRASSDRTKLSHCGGYQ